MHSSFYIPLYIVALLNFLIGLVVLLRNHKSYANLVYFWLVFSVSVWAAGLAGFILSDNLTVALYWAKIYYLSALAISVSLFLFTRIFGFSRKTPFRLAEYFYLGLATTFGLLLMLVPGFLTGDVTETGALGKSVTLNKLHYFFFTVLFLSGFVASLIRLWAAYKDKLNHLKAKQVRYLLVTIVASMLFGMAFNLVLPWLGNYDLIWVGPQFSIIFVIGTAIVIVRHKMFDIRLIIVRSLGYVLSIGFLILGLALASSLFIQRLFENSGNSWIPTTLNAVIFVVAVLTYPSVKKFFDRITNRFFFRDAYDPQEFLDQLNKSIVSNIEIGILLRRTTAIIQENIKSSFLQIVIPKTESTEERIVGTVDGKYSDHEINYMRGRLVGLGRKIVTVEDLGPDEDELQKIFNKHDIAVLVHLSASSYGQSQTIAYMIFGSKKSGNIYSKADLKIIEIIADELVIAIQNALRFEEIQDFNVTLQNKVNTATNKLRRTNEKLKAMDETKDEFISMASHQLRTPLTSVKGYLSMVLEGDAGEINDTQRKLLDQAFVSSQRMVYLIADLLNVSRLRTGKFIIDAHPANLADMVEGEISQLVGQARAKGITLTFEKPDDFPDLLIDETKTRQVIMNFVDNALFYTPSDGRIEIELSQDKGHVYFQVKDNGLGVPKDEQKHLFTKFYRAKNARNIRPDGTGLGLFMAKKVITAQGGNILFSSTEGKGSTFGFSFNKKHLALDRPAEEAGLGDSD